MKRFQHLSNYKLNLLIAKHSMKSQPFIKYLPQRNIFGEEFQEEDDTEWADDNLYIITESGREQKLNFCSYSTRCLGLVLEAKLDTSFTRGSECSGTVNTESGWFIKFTNTSEYCRSVAIAYLLNTVGTCGMEENQ